MVRTDIENNYPILEQIKRFLESFFQDGGIDQIPDVSEHIKRYKLVAEFGMKQ